MAATVDGDGNRFSLCSVLIKLGSDWWMDDNYSHGLLVPFVIYIVWLEFDKLKKARQTPQMWLGGGFILFAFLMIFGGTLGAELFTQRISFGFRNK